MTLSAVIILNTAGLICDIFGAWFVAWEVVNTYRGQRYKASPTVNLGGFGVGQKVADHTDYQGWEKSKLRKMKFGLFLLTTGFLLQIAGNWMPVFSV